MKRILSALALAALATQSAGAQQAHLYTDAQRGFSVAYPDGWRVDTEFQDKGYRFFRGETDDVRDGVALRPVGDLAPGTNLQSDQLVLAVERARPADRCTAGAFLMDVSPDTPTQTLIDKPDVARTITQAGDLYAIENIVVIVAQKPCLAAHYIIAFRRGPGAPPQFDYQKLIGLLNAMAATIKPVP